MLNTLERYTIAIPFRKEAKGKPSSKKSNSFFIDLLSYVCRSRAEYRAGKQTDQVQVPENRCFHIFYPFFFIQSFYNKSESRGHVLRLFDLLLGLVSVAFCREISYNEKNKLLWLKMEGTVMPNILWQDRKRFLGMPITFTKYSMSDDRLFVKKGFLNLATDELLLYRVRDISLRRSLGQRIFGVGSVIVVSSDQSTPTLELRNIRNSEVVKEMLHEQVEKTKIERRVRINELMDADEGEDEYLDDMDEV